MTATEFSHCPLSNGVEAPPVPYWITCAQALSGGASEDDEAQRFSAFEVHDQPCPLIGPQPVLFPRAAKWSWGHFFRLRASLTASLSPECTRSASPALAPVWNSKRERGFQFQGGKGAIRLRTRAALRLGWLVRVAMVASWDGYRFR